MFAVRLSATLNIQQQPWHKIVFFSSSYSALSSPFLLSSALLWLWSSLPPHTRSRTLRYSILGNDVFFNETDHVATRHKLNS